MRPHPDLLALERCLDEGRAPGVDLERRLDADPLLRRRARALRHVHARLADELGAAGQGPNPDSTARVLARLGAQPAAGTPVLMRPLSVAAAALLLVGLGFQRLGGVPASSPPAPAVELSRLLHWRAPLPAQALAPEAALVEEGQRLAADTRRVARSLWRRMPLASWLARDEELER